MWNVTVNKCKATGFIRIGFSSEDAFWSPHYRKHLRIVKISLGSSFLPLKWNCVKPHWGRSCQKLRKDFPLCWMEKCFVNASVYTTASAQLWRAIPHKIYMLRQCRAEYSEVIHRLLNSFLFQKIKRLNLSQTAETCVWEEVLVNLMLSILPHLTGFLKQKSLGFPCLVPCKARPLMLDICPMLNK